MEEKRWKAYWIRHPDFAEAVPRKLLHKETEPGYTQPHPVELKHHHSLFRKEFRLERQQLSGLFLDISADDYYKLYINGRFVAQGPAQGYPFHYYYNHLDVSSYVREGTNVIAVHVYYQGLVNRVYNSGDLRQGLIAELSAGGHAVCSSDTSWKCIRSWRYGSGNAETVGYETQFLEHLDCREDEPGWQLTGFDDSGWTLSASAANADYVLAEQPTPVVDVYRLPPANVTVLEDGHYLIDFGQEITGQFSMRAQGPAGSKVEIRCGEELSGDGSVRYDLRCNCRYLETWTLSGSEDLLEAFDYKAFRYVELIGPSKVMDIQSFSAVVRHYPLSEESCVFQTEDQDLQGIWDICAKAVRNCTQEVYLDCPSREKGQYLGDNTVIGHSHLYLSGDPRMYKKALRDFALSSAICPGLMAVVPGNLMQEIADFSCLWPLQLLTYYKHTGDLDFLREMAPYAEGIRQYFSRYRRADGLIEHVKEKWNLVDWPDNLRDDYDFPLTRPVSDGCHNVMNAFYIGCVSSVQEIKRILGLEYEDELPDLKNAFQNAFYRRNSKLFADTEASEHSSLHANVLPLFFGLAPDEAIPEITAFIRRKRFSCGVYMAYFVLKALAGVKEYGLIYELITSRDERSWNNMLREGATTCFEAWGKDQKWNTSLCHAWASSPIPVLIEDVFGLKPAEPGWRSMDYEPHLPEGMKPFQLKLTLPSGTVFYQFDGSTPKIIRA